MQSLFFKKSARFTLCALIFNNIVLVAAPALSKADVGNLLLSSYGAIQDNSKPQPIQLGLEHNEEKKEEVKFEIADLNPQERLKRAFTIAAQYEHKTAQPATVNTATSKALHNMLGDLEIFYCQDEENHAQHLFGQLKKFMSPLTSFGDVELATILANPTSNVKELQARQALIKELVNNEQLANEVQALLEKVAHSESALLSFWQEHNGASKEFLKTLYFSNDLLKPFNNNALALELGTRLGNLGTAYQIFGDIFVSAIMLKLLMQNSDLLNSMYGYMLDVKNDAPLSTFIVKSAKNSYWPVDGIQRAIRAHNSPVKNAVLGNYEAAIWASMACVQSGNLLFKAYTTRNILTQAALTKNTINFLQTRLISAATLITTAKECNILANANRVLAQGISGHTTIAEFFKKLPDRSDNFATLIKQLQTNTFKGEASFFSLSGRVLSANTLIEQNKTDLGAFMSYIGELDACLALARLYKKFEYERVKFCFVNYATCFTKPYIKLEQFWNPMVEAAVVVPNNLELGAPGIERNVILTGANTGGKSTALKAIMISMLFAHTIGMVPAHEATITLCDFLGTSLNIKDNTAQGTSLYQAEVNRATGLIKAAEQMRKEGKLCFLVLDELFRGTRPEKADKETYECAKRLADLNNTSFILATHYLDKPITLEAETKGLCKNYKIDAYVDENGAIVHTYKLEPGVTQHNIASEILQAGLDAD